jgi:dTDP-4-dehydrorhamnose reductase
LNTWLILGGNGQLGKSVAHELENRDIKYRALGREDADITDQMQIDALFESIRPSMVINAAAWTAVDLAEESYSDAFAVNCDGARTVAIASKKWGARLIHISTDYVFSGELSGPYEVKDATNPKTVYGQSKLCGEKAVVSEYADGSVIVRTAWLYSQYGNNFVKTIIRKAMRNETINVVDDQFGQPTSASDLSNFLVELGRNFPNNEILHGTNSGQCSWFDLAQTIYECVGCDPALVLGIDSSSYPTKAPRPRHSALSHERLSELGIPSMRDWKLAALEEVPHILSTMKTES